MNNKSKALVVFSGGQDSTTCLFWAKKEFGEVEAISFDYGQKHRLELELAAKIAREAGVPFQVMQLEMLGKITNNALTNPDMEVETDKPDNRPPNTLVEGRNMLFLTYAAIYAKSKDIHHLVTGVGQADYSGYPDCRDEFIRSLNQTLNLSMDYEYEIHTPLMWRDKEAVWQLSDELGVFDLVRTQTLTCYNGIVGEGCGHCPACKLRKNGLDSYLLKKNHKSDQSQ
ncbi:7-cyano-7-deazaguanine synthase QueC [Mangrovibacterium diazotrophicum]|uniref:7-cyano-7-deazaguanine synthase n=1 Tax=Mangrovibacterium diazotrophicum TaxID=1261403 RepID=A0A419W8D2_9BACT|nr:7-cyano-7-deazaguanine synthase QueC [Mangrovibacterium diazotrophicum]RKD91741.1 preQ(0) biosynthesis protein QueC [Mangrovibacterium diazotrophicum]